MVSTILLVHNLPFCILRVDVKCDTWIKKFNNQIQMTRLVTNSKTKVKCHGCCTQYNMKSKRDTCFFVPKNKFEMKLGRPIQRWGMDYKFINWSEGYMEQPNESYDYYIQHSNNVFNCMFPYLNNENYCR